MGWGLKTDARVLKVYNGSSTWDSLSTFTIHTDTAISTIFLIGAVRTEIPEEIVVLGNTSVGTNKWVGPIGTNCRKGPKLRKYSNSVF